MRRVPPPAVVSLKSETERRWSPKRSAAPYAQGADRPKPKNKSIFRPAARSGFNYILHLLFGALAGLAHSHAPFFLFTLRRCWLRPFGYAQGDAPLGSAPLDSTPLSHHRAPHHKEVLGLLLNGSHDINK